MSLFDHIRRRPASREPLGPPALDLPRATEAVGTLARTARPCESALLRAQIADRLRDVDVQPPAPEEVDLVVAAWDEDGWERAAIAVMLIDPLPPTVYEALNRAVVGSTGLTRALLGGSEVRAEELARGVAEAFSRPILGETPEQSRKRLQKINYQSLLSSLDQARASAEERMAALAAAQRPRPRGKM